MQEVDELLSTTPVEGFNITIPYKEKIIPLLSYIEPVAKKIRAVNCIVKRKNSWHGYNTDIIGFEEEITEMLSPLPYVVPLQLLSYYISVERGIDPDKPKNLAKCVTVE